MAYAFVVFPRNAMLFFFVTVCAYFTAARAYGDMAFAAAGGSQFVAFAPMAPALSPDMISDFADVNSTLLEIGTQQSDTQKEARQRHFNPGTSVVIGIIAAFGFLQSTPRAAVLLSL